MRKLALVLFAAVGLATFVAPASHASITTSGSYQTGTPTPTLNITTRFSLTITTTGNFAFLVLDEWVTSDHTGDFASCFGTQSLLYQIDGSAAQSIVVRGLTDNLTATVGAITPNDGYLTFGNSVAVTAGQTVTFLLSSLTFSSGGNTFNTPPAVFNGNVFLFSNNEVAVSALTSVVPEPSTWAMLSLGTVGVCVVVLRQRTVV